MFISALILTTMFKIVVTEVGIILAAVCLIELTGAYGQTKKHTHLSFLPIETSSAQPTSNNLFVEYEEHKISKK